MADFEIKVETFELGHDKTCHMQQNRRSAQSDQSLCYSLSG